MMIGSIFAGIKAIKGGISVVKGFAKAWKMYLLIAAVVSVLVTAWVYVGNHSKMKAELVANDALITQLYSDLEHVNLQVFARDDRIRSMNNQRMEEVEAARARLQMARDMVLGLQLQNENILEELKFTQFKTLEAIRDDEDFADWVDYPVPSAAWRLLDQATQGPSN
ncbi:MAG: hypothetical protein JRE23_15495 [Deltaproteobacteria bacterium]|nr:hypothetical protein [Deltaproteobacteria bacterium]